MARLFDVILDGSDIMFDNTADQMVIGFLTARRLSAETAEEAARQARHRVLVHWNQSYNADRKLGVPRLHTVEVAPAQRWKHRTPSQDYFFYDGDDVRDAHLAYIRDSARPWYRLAKRSLAIM